jgi:hypothetical protein
MPDAGLDTPPPPLHLFGLVALTVGVSALISMPNALTLSGTAPVGVGRVVMLLANPVAFAAAVLGAWLFVRRSRQGCVPAPARAPTDAATDERGPSIACFLFAIAFLLLGVLSFFGKTDRLSMVNWLIGRAPWERDAAIFMGLGLAAWGVAYATLGVHYSAQRYRWLAHSSLLQAVLGWLFLALAVWVQWSHMAATD